MNVSFTDNSEEFLEELERKRDRALEAMGILGENYAKGVITSESRVDTGNMRNSVSHTVKEDTAYIGTNNEYAVYHELGTGIYLDPAVGRGRQDPWYYKDSKGVWHKTVGIKPIHFLKRAVQDHIQDYKRIANEMKGN